MFHTVVVYSEVLSTQQQYYIYFADFVALLKMLIFLLLLNVFSSLHKCVVDSLGFLVSVLLRRNV